MQPSLMTLLYNFFIFLFQLSIRIASLFGNAKARNWLEGRKNIFRQIEQTLIPGEERIWFHCASLGEFEQGRPVIEKLKMLHADCKIVLTFFSPSGYEVRKNYKGADYVFYLPLDTRSNAEKFISLINPSEVFFVKYEFWFHYLNRLHQLHIPVYLVSAIFRPQQVFFKWYGGFFLKMLKTITHFFLQDEGSAVLLQSKGISNFTVTGDTRFDRVVEAAAAVKPIPVIEKFIGTHQLFIAGSTWKEDEQIIQRFIQQHPSVHSSFKFIIAPHEIDEPHIQFLVKLFAGSKVVRISEANSETISSFDVLIIDNIGMLSSIYQYGNLAFIGGGFGKGIHNILEAAVFGMPILFGPNYSRFSEAIELIKRNGAFSVESSEELKIVFTDLLSNEGKWKAAGLIAKTYTHEQTGATTKIVNRVKKD